MTHLDSNTMKDLTRADINGHFPVLMSIYNPDIFWTDEEKATYQQEDGYMHFISDNITVKYKGKTWLPCAFSFTPPDKDGKKISAASVSISALDVRVRQLLTSIELTSEITLEAMFSKEKNKDGHSIYKFAELNSIKFLMTSASLNKTVATFNLVPDLNMQQNIPYDTALPNRVPSART